MKKIEKGMCILCHSDSEEWIAVFPRDNFEAVENKGEFLAEIANDIWTNGGEYSNVRITFNEEETDKVVEHYGANLLYHPWWSFNLHQTAENGETWVDTIELDVRLTNLYSS